MISEIRIPDVRRALQLLLLPSGLNLRNLVWHGFVPELPRHWLSVVVVLAIILQEDDHVKIENPLDKHDLDLKLVDGFESVFLYDIDVTRTTEAVLDWLPKTHHALWYLAIDWYKAKTKPVSTMAILIVLLESGLRQIWCRCNEKPDLIAVPTEYFVTLDGFGQRKKQHNILLHPYLLDNGSRNKLIEFLPGSSTALITDLFCSPGGPNIRGLVSHGSYDANLLEEWERHNDCDGTSENLWQTTHTVLVGLHLAASREGIDYQPVFSNSAVSEQLLNQAQVQLRELRDLQVDCQKYASVATRSIGDTKTIDVVPESFAAFRLLPQRRSWTADDVFFEHQSNVKLANVGAAQMLLRDVEIATATHKRELQEALNSLEESKDVGKRKQKRNLRIVESTHAAYSLYRFGMCVAFLHLKEQLTEGDKTVESVSMRAVERARMVISTFDTFLHSNTERAMKSLREYNTANKTREIAGVICHQIFQEDANV
ncbi:unnamed protein product [Cylindrotheca closterium]|uniref:DUF4209 domain-containing protein n=1 Tax=Cylindrotheca closterium TaxID=2856 RepID=A0AAD2CUY1_9STRA|nr:unnamed protein product [Cylindrotheca closterium]